MPICQEVTFLAAFSLFLNLLLLKQQKEYKTHEIIIWSKFNSSPTQATLQCVSKKAPSLRLFLQQETSKRDLYKAEHAAKDREVSAEGDNLGKVWSRPGLFWEETYKPGGQREEKIPQISFISTGSVWVFSNRTGTICTLQRLHFYIYLMPNFLLKSTPRAKPKPPMFFPRAA